MPRPHPAAPRQSGQPSSRGQGERQGGAGWESGGNLLQVSSGGIACSQPCSQPATDLVSRDSFVSLLNCVITLVRPLRGRQTGFPCLQVPARWKRRSSRQLGPLSPSSTLAPALSLPATTALGWDVWAQISDPSSSCFQVRFCAPWHTLAHLMVKTALSLN